MNKKFLLIGGVALAAWFFLKPKQEDENIGLGGGGSSSIPDVVGGGTALTEPTQPTTFSLPSVSLPPLPESAFSGNTTIKTPTSKKSTIIETQQGGAYTQVTSPTGAVGYYSISPAGVGLSTSSLALAKSTAAGALDKITSTPSKKSTPSAGSTAIIRAYTPPSPPKTLNIPPKKLPSYGSIFNSVK